MNAQALRKDIVATLGQLAERYPNLRIGQIIGNALGDAHDLQFTPDADIARALNQLMVAYTQFQAAGIAP